MGAKYKIGQELQTADGDRHVVEEIRYRYVVKRVYAVPVPGVRPGIGCLNSYDEEDLSPYVRPLGVGDRVRRNGDPTSGGEVRYVEGNEIWYRSDTTRTLCTGDAGDYYRIPTEAGK